MELLKFRAVYIKIIVKNTSADPRHCGPPLTGAATLLLSGSFCRLSALVPACAHHNSRFPPLCKRGAQDTTSSYPQRPIFLLSSTCSKLLLQALTAFPPIPNSPRYSSAVLTGGENSCSTNFCDETVSEGSFVVVCKVVTAP